MWGLLLLLLSLILGSMVVLLLGSGGVVALARCHLLALGLLVASGLLLQLPRPRLLVGLRLVPLLAWCQLGICRRGLSPLML